MMPSGVRPPWRSRPSWFFQRPDDRLDALPQPVREVPGLLLVLAGRAQQYQVTPGQVGLEVAAEVVLVADDGLPGMLVHHVTAGLEHVQERLALIGLGAGQGEQHRQPGQRADQVQPQPPEVPGVTGAVAVLRPPGGVAAPDRLPGPAALHRRGVHHPHVIAPQRGVHRQHPDHPDEQDERLAEPIVVPGLADPPREHHRQVITDIAQPPALRGEPEQGSHHRHRQQLSIGQRRREPISRTFQGKTRPVPQHVIDLDVQCSRESLYVIVHNLDRGDSRLFMRPDPLESLI